MNTPEDDREGDDMTAPAPAPRRSTVQLNVRLRADYDQALRAYAARYDAGLQTVVTDAVGEYLGRRGALPE